MSFLWLFLSIAFSQTPTLSFPVEKNNVKVLPQRFEYQLIDKDRVRIGDIVMDANEIGFQITSESFSKGRYKIKFTWPAGLLTQGEIAIKDNSGKAIWIHQIDTSKIQYTKPKTADSSDRAAIANYETSTNANRLVREIQMYPFFQFCVNREEELTKIYVCSKDLYVEKEKNGQQILSRDSYRPQSYVEINGRPVGPKGLILLNSEEEFISLRALLLSGANIEVYTRMRNVQFNNVTLSPDGKQIIIQARGAEPVDATMIKKIDSTNTQWEASLDIGRPFTYLKGQGDLPLRQEFVIQGNVRPEDVQVEILKGATEKTSAGEVTLTLRPSEGLVLSPADPETGLRRLKNGTYEWTLKSLNRNEVNRRFVRVKKGEDVFTAAYDLERISSLEARAFVSFPLWAETSILWSATSMWDLQLGYSQTLTKDSDPTKEKLSAATFNIRYRTNAGVRLRESTYFAALQAQQFSSPGQDLNLYGLQLGREMKSPILWSKYFEWTFLTLGVPLAASDSAITVSAFDLEVSVRKTTSAGFFWDLGLKHRSMETTKEIAPGTSAKFTFSQPSVFAGVGANF
jgi:hypothetical protein